MRRKKGRARETAENKEGRKMQRKRGGDLEGGVKGDSSVQAETGE